MLLRYVDSAAVPNRNIFNSLDNKIWCFYSTENDALLLLVDDVEIISVEKCKLVKNFKITSRVKTRFERKTRGFGKIVFHLCNHKYCKTRLDICLGTKTKTAKLLHRERGSNAARDDT